MLIYEHFKKVDLSALNGYQKSHMFGNVCFSFLTLSSMRKIGLFPGSFDPFTKGHEFIVSQSLEIFDEIIIGIGVNTEKKYLFDLKKELAI